MSKEKETWECPICGDPRYQKYGGTPILGTNQDGKPATVHFGRHFMCKGCSIFFSNPRLFNAKKISEKKRVKAHSRILPSLGSRGIFDAD